MRTDERIVSTMAELLRVQGYAATGIKQLAEAAGAPVGSIYHHFPGGKAEIVARVLRTTGSAYVQLVPLLLDPHEDLVAGIVAAFDAAADDIERTGWANLCPVGTVTGEIADTEPALRAVAAEVMDDWVEQLSAYLEGRGLGAPDARVATYALLSALEGGFLLARGLHASEPLRAAGRSVAAHVATLPVAVR